MDVRKDYYAALNLRSAATVEDIKSAYRGLALRLHPDTNPEQEAIERFREIQEAYDILSDPAQRRAYDQWREKEGLARPLPLTIKPLLSHHKLPQINEEQVLYILLEIVARPNLGESRLPVNLCLVIDRSTSMQGIRLQRVKDATSVIIDYLDDSDVFSLVTFSDRAEVVIPAQSALDKGYAKSRVSPIRSAGGTEILQGMLAGLDQIDRWRSPNMVNHLVLLTDGQTYGGEEECLRQAESASLRQISITTMGIGQDWNDKLLDEIAHRSGGTSIYIDSTSKVTSAFRECVLALKVVVARSAQLIVRMPNGVRLHQAFRVSPRLEWLQLKQGAIGLGQIPAEQPSAVLLELLISPQVAGKAHVAQMELIADVPSWGHEQVTVKHDVEVDIVADLETMTPVPPAIVSAAGKLAIFKMQEKTMEDLEKGEIGQASQRLETMATRLLNIGENELAKAALLEAGRLSRTGHLSPEGRKRIRYGTRSLSMLPTETIHG